MGVALLMALLAKLVYDWERCSKKLTNRTKTAGARPGMATAPDPPPYERFALVRQAPAVPREGAQGGRMPCIRVDGFGHPPYDGG
jgi:hypothetical protein